MADRRFDDLLSFIASHQRTGQDVCTHRASDRISDLPVDPDQTDRFSDCSAAKTLQKNPCALSESGDVAGRSGACAGKNFAYAPKKAKKT